MLSSIRSWIKKAKVRNDKVVKETTLLNVQRFFLIGLIAAPVSLAHIIVFWFTDSDTTNEALWRTSIIIAHLLLMSLMLLVMWLGRVLNKRADYQPIFKIYHLGLMIMVFAFGIAITAIDQLIFTNVTPFIIASLVCGIVFYTRPRDSIIIYTLGVIVFVIVMGIIITDGSVRLSNQVNGLTIGALGMFLSLIQWQRKVINIEQAQMIEHQQNELKESNERLNYLASHDLLTGLLNRESFTRKVEEEIKQNQIGCLMFLDIDFFKKINDTYGHPVGDTLLRNIAQDFKKLIPNNGIICRWGGDEFLVYLPNTSLDKGTKIGNVIRTKISEKQYKLKENSLYITISCGITSVNNTVKDSFHLAYERADQALYQAKEKGKNGLEKR